MKRRKVILFGLAILVLVFTTLVVKFPDYIENNIQKVRSSLKLDVGTPIWISQHANELATSDAEKYFCCEIKDRLSEFKNVFEELSKPEFEARYYLVHETSNTSLVSVEYKLEGDTYDYYYHFTKTGNEWKFDWVRGFPDYAFLKAVVTAYENEDARKSLEADNSLGLNFEEIYRQVKLTIKSDKELIQHFKDNEGQFESLLALTKDKSLDAIFLESEEVKEITNKTIAEPVEDKSLCYNCRLFLIGGITDNSVGYLYVDNVEDLPEVDGKSFILLRKIKDGWYLYKTT